MNHHTIFDENFEILEEDKEFSYQKELTPKLDANAKDFDQNILNEIVLWKINRFALFDPSVINELNSIDPNSKILDVAKTHAILLKLLRTKGVQLAMASTILRFRNPNVYQIIDQRVYRILYKNKILKISSSIKETKLTEQIELYLQYVKDLKKACMDLNISFSKADRILFMANKRINKEFKLRNY